MSESTLACSSSAGAATVCIGVGQGVASRWEAAQPKFAVSA